MKKIKSLLRKITRKKYVTFSSEEIGFLNGSLSDVTTTKSPQHSCYPDMMYISGHQGREVEEKGPIANWWETDEENPGRHEPTGMYPPYICIDQSASTGQHVSESGDGNEDTANSARSVEERLVSTMEGDESYHRVQTLPKKILQSPIIHVDHVAPQDITEDRDPTVDQVCHVLDGERQAHNDDDGLRVRTLQSEDRMTIPDWAEDAERTPARLMVGHDHGQAVAGDCPVYSAPHCPAHSNEIHHNINDQSDQGSLHRFHTNTITNDDEPPYLPLVEDSDVSNGHMKELFSSVRAPRDPNANIEIPVTSLCQHESPEIQTSYSSSTGNENSAKISWTDERRSDMTEEESLQCLLYSYYREMQSHLDMEKIELFMFETRMNPDKCIAPGSPNLVQQHPTSHDSNDRNREDRRCSTRVSQQGEMDNGSYSLHNLFDKSPFEPRYTPSLVNKSLLESQVSRTCNGHILTGDVPEKEHLKSLAPCHEKVDSIHNPDVSERATMVTALDDHQTSFLANPLQVDHTKKVPVGYLIALFESIARRGNGDPSSNWNAMTKGIKLLQWHSSHMLDSDEYKSNSDMKSPTTTVYSQTNDFREVNQRDEISENEYRQPRTNDFTPWFRSNLGELYSIEEGDESILEEAECLSIPPVVPDGASSHLSNISLPANQELTGRGLDPSTVNATHTPTVDKCIALYDTATIHTYDLDTCQDTHPRRREQGITKITRDDRTSRANRDGSVKLHSDDGTTRPKRPQYNVLEVQSESSSLQITRKTDFVEPVEVGEVLKGEEQIEASLGNKFVGSIVQQPVSLVESDVMSTNSEKCTIQRQISATDGDKYGLSLKLSSVDALPTNAAKTADRPAVSNNSSHSRRSHDGDSWWIGTSRSSDIAPHPETRSQDEGVQSTKDSTNKPVRRNRVDKHRQRDLDKAEGIPYEVCVKPPAKGGSQHKKMKDTKKVSLEATVVSHAKSAPLQKQRHYCQDDNRARTTSQEDCVDLRARSFPSMTQRSDHYYEVSTKSQITSLNPSTQSVQSPKNRRRRVQEAQKKANVNAKVQNVLPRKQSYRQLDETEDERHEDKAHPPANGLSSQVQRHQPCAQKISHEARVHLRSQNGPSLKQRCQHFYEVEKSSTVNPKAPSVSSRKQRHQQVHEKDEASRGGRVKERPRFVSSQKPRHQHFYEVGNMPQDGCVNARVRDSPSVKKRQQAVEESTKEPLDVSRALPILLDDNSLRSISDRTRTLLSASDDALIGHTLSSSPSDEGEDFPLNDPHHCTETTPRHGQDQTAALSSNARGHCPGRIYPKSQKYQKSARTNDRTAEDKNRGMHNVMESRPEAPKNSHLGGRAFSQISALAGFVASGLRQDVAKSTQGDTTKVDNDEQARYKRSSVNAIDNGHMIETDVGSLSPSDEGSDKPSDEEDMHKDFQLPRRKHQAPRNTSNNWVSSSKKSCDEPSDLPLPNESSYDCLYMGESADVDSQHADFMPSDEEVPQIKVSMNPKTRYPKDKGSSKLPHHQQESRAHSTRVHEEPDEQHNERNARKSRSRKTSSSSSSSTRKPSHRASKQSSTGTRRTEAKGRKSRAMPDVVHASWETSFFQNLSPMARMRLQRQIFDNEVEAVPTMQCF